MWNLCGEGDEMDQGLAATVGRALRNWATPGAGRGRGFSVELVWLRGSQRDTAR